MTTKDEDYAAMDRDEERRDTYAERNSLRCRCSNDPPGACPGPENCPMWDDGDEEDIVARCCSPSVIADHRKRGKL